MAEWLGNLDNWKLLSIPLVAALVGWLTNWLAVQMTFYPLEFVGIGRIGWQGIIPSKARRMAGLSIQSILSKLGSLSEVFDKMDPQRIARHVIVRVDPMLDTWVDEIMAQHHPVLWGNAPKFVRQQVYARVRRELPDCVDALLKDIGANIETLIDLKALVEDQAVADKRLLNRIFQECGAAEFRFLIQSGLYFGGALGVLLMLQWWLYPAWWTLPLGGLIVGYATNWLALNLIFRPLNPVRIAGIRLQGLFLRRQNEVAETFCRIVTREVITLSRLVEAMLHGKYGARTQSLIRKHIRPLVDEAAGFAKLSVQSSLGPTAFAELRSSVGDKAVQVADLPFGDAVFDTDRAVIVENVMRERMQALSPAEFQNLLRPAFHEDELKLILVGAALGAAAGVAQLLLVFGGV